MILRILRSLAVFMLFVFTLVVGSLWWLFWDHTIFRNGFGFRDAARNIWEGKLS